MYRDRTIGLVLPARNEERLILRTLTSVPDYVDSVYVVDDASIDRTRDLVRERATSDARVRLLCHEENVGPGSRVGVTVVAGDQDNGGKQPLTYAITGDNCVNVL